MQQDARIDRLPREGELFDAKYRIGPVLGVGGMAAVLAARHLGFDEMVAIKVLLPECSDDAAVVERFVQEGRTAVKIRSEHVVRMLDVGVFEGRAYLVMEHLDGKDLDRLVREGGPLPATTAVDLLLQACEAISEAHVLGIVHRDLKPANLFLTHRADGSPCVKVLDFGISKMPRSVSGASFSSSPPTLPAMVMGSPQYMSPEQMMSAASADQRSDIWSLGTVLYELLTGQIAFDGGSTAEVCARVLQGTPTPLEQLQPDVPNGVALVVARCLEKDPKRRYSNVAELARALAPFGSPSARASADSILRVHEGRPEVPLSPVSEAGTMKPTAKAILATPPRRQGGRVSGYLGALLLALATAGAGLAGAHRYLGFWPLAIPTAVAGSPIPATSAAFAPAETPRQAPSASAAASAVPSAVVAAVPAERPHAHHRHPAQTASSTSALGTTDPQRSAEDGGAGPYDEP
jgi:serine/threonine-protein kinase